MRDQDQPSRNASNWFDRLLQWISGGPITPLPAAPHWSPESGRDDGRVWTQSKPGGLATLSDPKPAPASEPVSELSALAKGVIESLKMRPYQWTRWSLRTDVTTLDHKPTDSRVSVYAGSPGIAGGVYLNGIALASPTDVSAIRDAVNAFVKVKQTADLDETYGRFETSKSYFEALGRGEDPVLPDSETKCDADAVIHDLAQKMADEIAGGFSKRLADGGAFTRKPKKTKSRKSRRK